MNDFIVYPALFWYDIPDEVAVTFPDLPGCTGQCRKDCDVYAYAQETLGFYLADAEVETLPEPSRIQDIPHEEDTATVPVRIYLPAYREEMDSKSEKRTVTLPRWLNRAALREKINFSETLRDALMSKLGIYLKVSARRYN